MAPPLTFTFDLEDHRPAGEPWPERFTEPTLRILEWLEERSIRGTFFVVGTLAQDHPQLVRRIAGHGHEVGLHHWTHTQLTEMTPAQFRVDVDRGKRVLEDILGEEVAGYRAPTASLVPRTAAAADLLAEAGYQYSSSVLPAHNPLFGFPGAPNEPFRWPCGLAEFPLAVAGFGPAKVPVTGGTYLRALPWPVVAAFRRFQPWAPGNSVYFHPYDIDPDEPFWWVDDAGRLAPILWIGRRGMLGRLDRLFADGGAPPLRERMHLADRGGVFHPPATVGVA
ncbi:MAG: polysaccharide deacetylase family protein [Acidimicrobiia bacterium]|nr:polysaccharide deacetylase family protein [Acidimicrobiia bacterium]